MYITENLRDFFLGGNFNYIKVSYYELILESSYT